MPKEKPAVMQGRTVFPGGRRVELMAPYEGWLDWAEKVLMNAADDEKENRHAIVQRKRQSGFVRGPYRGRVTSGQRPVDEPLSD